MNTGIRKLLEGVSDGTVSVDDAILKLKTKPFEDIGYAKVDLHRELRQDTADVIYGTGESAEQMTGRGAGLSSGGLRRKKEVITRAIALHKPDAADALDVLSKVGGFDLAGLTGIYLGAAAMGMPAVMDGFISGSIQTGISSFFKISSSHFKSRIWNNIVLDALE